MTRGTFYLITQENTYASVEFNGDMYPGGHYGDALVMLDNVESLEDFEKGVRLFNKEHHDYPEDEVYVEANSKSSPFDMVDNYIENWFSDWIFVKNISGVTISFKCKNYVGNEITYLLPNNKLATFNFGKFYQSQ